MTPIARILEKEVSSGRTPSVQYYLFDKKNIIYECRFGLADIQAGKKLEENTTYNAFSVTKTFTALAVLQLAQNSFMKLDDPVIHYLPDFPYGREITIRHILNHSGGLPNPVPLSWIHLVGEHRAFDARAFFESIFKKHRKAKSKPGENFAYSNLGYVVLGQLIEKISGTSYENYIKQNIISRLSLQSDELCFEIKNPDRHAKGYHKRMSFTNYILGFLIDKAKFMDKPEGRWKPFKFIYVNGISYGGLIGKPLGFVRYLQELLKDDNKLINPYFNKLLLAENKNTGMCLSWFTGSLHGIPYYAHAGGGGGYYCEIRMYPDKHTGSVVFFNRTGMTDERFLDKVDKYYLGDLIPAKV